MTTATERRHWLGLFVIAVLLVLLLAGLLLGQERYRPPLPVAMVVEVTAVQPYGPAYRAGLEVGDRILEIGDARVRSLPELRQLLGESGESARLTVQQRRTGKAATVHVYPERGRIGIDARMVVAYPYGPYPY